MLQWYAQDQVEGKEESFSELWRKIWLSHAVFPTQWRRFQF